MKKRKTQAEIDAEIARFRAVSEAFDKIPPDDQIEVLEEAMRSGSLPVRAKITKQ